MTVKFSENFNWKTIKDSKVKLISNHLFVDDFNRIVGLFYWWYWIICLEEILRQNEKKIFWHYKSRNSYALIFKMACWHDFKRDSSTYIELELWFEILYIDCQMCVCVMSFVIVDH